MPYLMYEAIRSITDRCLGCHLMHIIRKLPAYKRYRLYRNLGQNSEKVVNGFFRNVGN